MSNLQHCLSTLNYVGKELLDKMNINADCLVINQCDKLDYEKTNYKEHHLEIISVPERGISKSREVALNRCSGDIIILSDDDVRYYKGYEKIIKKVFDKHPEADMVCFKINRLNSDNRKNIKHSKFKRVHFYNGLRYGAINFVFRRRSIVKNNIHFHRMFGSSIYGSGEDTLFMIDALKKGLIVYSIDLAIGEVDMSTSSWFDGYNKRYFINRGALFEAISSKFAYVLCMQFYIRHKELFDDVDYKTAMRYMNIGRRRYRHYGRY